MISVINPTAQLKKARDSTRKSDLAAIQSALENYYATYNKYPSETGTDGMTCVASALVTGDANCNGSVADANEPDKYMKELPVDPSVANGFHYCYKYYSSGQDYVLCAKIESGDGVDNTLPATFSGCNASGTKGKENYCVTN